MKSLRLVSSEPRWSSSLLSRTDKIAWVAQALLMTCLAKKTLPW